MERPALPTLRQLAYLVELSARLNFRVAAEARFVTPSTLSAGIKELDTGLGVQLVERENRNVRLTPIGEARVADRAAGSKVVALRKIDTGDMLLLEEGHCLRDHAIAACGPRRGTWEARVEATSLTTLIQMVEGGLGVTLLAGITLEAGILKGTRLVARRFSPPVPSGMLALVARRTSPRRRDADLLADFLIDQRRSSR